VARSLEELQKKLNQAGMSDIDLTLIWKIDPHNIYGFKINGSQAFAYWKQLHAIKDTIAHYPLITTFPQILDVSADLERHQNVIDFNAGRGDRSPINVAGNVEQGLQLKAKDWLDLRAKGWQQDWEDYLSDDFCSEEEKLETQKEKELLDAYTLTTVGAWNSEIPPADESIIMPTHRRTSDYSNKVWIALIPTTLSWEIPAFLQFGNWNDCPPPAVHVGLMKYWQEQYGAEVVCISHDVIEMWVKNPPNDRESAFKLAQEQYLYCADIVDQGCETLNNLAATLLNGKTWYFWWD
jgi:Domain of unknown function (DUF4253)